MPINISYQPAAGAVAGLGLLGGQGDYSRYLNNYLNGQYQFAVNTGLQQAQLAQDRMKAMQDAALQQQRMAADLYSQQQGQAFDLAKMPLQADLNAQAMQFQANLNDRSHYQQSYQNFQQQQQLSAQQAQQQADNQAAAIQLTQQGQLANQQAMQDYAGDQRIMQQFNADPLMEYKQNKARVEQSGYDYSDDQKMRMQKAINDLNGMQEAIQSGRNYPASLLGDIKKNMAILSKISASPENAPQPTLADRVSKSITFGWKDPATGQIKPGTENIAFTVDDKGNSQVVRGFSMDSMGSGGMDEEGNPILISGKASLNNIKAQREQFRNNVEPEKWVSEMLQKEGGIQFKMMDPQGYAMRQQELRNIVAKMAPGLAKPVHQDPNVAPEQVPQQPQGPQWQKPQPHDPNQPQKWEQGPHDPNQPAQWQQQAPPQQQQPQGPPIRLSPKMQEVIINYQHKGNQQAAQAAYGAAQMVSQLGEDWKKWPLEAQVKYIQLYTMAPDIPI